MKPEHKKYILTQMVWSAGINFIINGLAAWLIYKKYTSIPLLGDTSISMDAIFTVVILTFINVPLVAAGILKLLYEKKLPRFESRKTMPPALRWLVRHIWVFDLIVTVLLAITLPLIIVGKLELLHVNQMSFWFFVFYKAVFAALLAALVNWLVCLSELKAFG
jgi:hypothetical protein